MAEEAGHFTFDEVVTAIADKMVARHPHVFGDESRDKSAEQQTRDWETVKAAERAAKARGGVLEDVALALPALMRAEKLQKRAARVGFDWPDIGQVVDKIAEEARELAEARDSATQDEIEDEMGDLLFVMANLARHLKVDPEVALRRANSKFTRRFAFIEAELAEARQTPRGQRPGRDGRALGRGQARGALTRRPPHGIVRWCATSRPPRYGWTCGAFRAHALAAMRSLSTAIRCLRRAALPRPLARLHDGDRGRHRAVRLSRRRRVRSDPEFTLPGPATRG
jgi:NTP pyrophosphatase (non-canonical NTP hydrolase)